MKPFSPKKALIGRLLKPVWTVLGILTRRKKTESTSPANILIVDLHLIGDIVMLTPFISAIAKKYPSARISLLAGPWAKIILKNFEEIDEYFVLEAPWVKYDRKIKRWRDVFSMVKLLRKQQWDLAIDIRGDVRHDLFLRFVNVKRLVAFSFFGNERLIDDVVPYDNSLTHLVDYHQRILEFLGASEPGIKYQPFLKINKQERDSVKEQANYIGIHFGASLPLKRPSQLLMNTWLDEIAGLYPVENIVVFGLQEAPEITDHIYNYLKNKRTAGVQTWNGGLRDFIVVLTKCDHLFCLDSGPGHIGAALGIRETVVFGPTIISHSHPVGSNTTILTGADVPCRAICNLRVCINQIDRACMPLSIVQQ